MGVTSIEWTARTRIDGTIVPGFTFNPWIGCSKIDPLCDNCYASVDTFTRVNRARGRELWGPDAERHVTSPANWLKPIKWDRDAAAAGELRGVFCASLADICEDRRELDAPREWLWELIRWCDSLDFMLLTKRPQNIGRLVPQDILDRVWMGVSAGTVAGLKRVELLMRHRAFRRFVSAEPLLEDVDFDPMDLAYRDADGRPVDLVIVGGESGRNPRPCHVDWIFNLLEDCRLAGVDAFVKQLGANVMDRNDVGFDGDEGDRWPEATLVDPWWLEHPTYRHQGGPCRVMLRNDKGGDPAEWPRALRVRQMPTEARP